MTRSVRGENREPRKTTATSLVVQLRTIGDPFAILGVERDADDSQISAAAAYRSAQSKSGGERRALQAAYDLIRDADSRRRVRLLLPLPADHPDEVAARARVRPRYLGPRAWLSHLASFAKNRGDKT